MIGGRRVMVFSLIASIAYTLAYYFDWPLFRYYLDEGRLSFSAQPESAGPPILWYGWLVMAALAGLVIAIILPRPILARLPPDLLWIIPIASILAAFLYEMRWFI
jgi:hypothetical protein